jgi:hypothetical protein
MERIIAFVLSYLNSVIIEILSNNIGQFFIRRPLNNPYRQAVPRLNSDKNILFNQ